MFDNLIYVYVFIYLFDKYLRVIVVNIWGILVNKKDNDLFFYGVKFLVEGDW